MAAGGAPGGDGEGRVSVRGQGSDDGGWSRRDRRHLWQASGGWEASGTIKVVGKGSGTEQWRRDRGGRRAGGAFEATGADRHAPHILPCARVRPQVGLRRATRRARLGNDGTGEHGMGDRRGGRHGRVSKRVHVGVGAGVAPRLGGWPTILGWRAFPRLGGAHGDSGTRLGGHRAGGGLGRGRRVPGPGAGATPCEGRGAVQACNARAGGGQRPAGKVTAGRAPDAGASPCEGGEGSGRARRRAAAGCEARY